MMKMNRTRDRTKVHMLHHEIRFRKLVPMGSPFIMDAGLTCTLYYVFIDSNMRTMPVFGEWLLNPLKLQG